MEKWISFDNEKPFESVGERILVANIETDGSQILEIYTLEYSDCADDGSDYRMHGWANMDGMYTFADDWTHWKEPSEEPDGFTDWDRYHDEEVNHQLRLNEQFKKQYDLYKQQYKPVSKEGKKTFYEHHAGVENKMYTETKFGGYYTKHYLIRPEIIDTRSRADIVKEVIGEAYFGFRWEGNWLVEYTD